MKILLLGPDRPRFEAFLASQGDEVLRLEDKITGLSPQLKDIDWLVSYGYRHILRHDVLRKLPGRAINLHISYLPWNRGADPNLWSFLEDTPKGVTIHLIDSGVDTGDILAQRVVDMRADDTLQTSYERLSLGIDTLFCEVWPEIRAGRVQAQRQPSGGSVHRVKDKLKYEHLLRVGWDTPVADIVGKALTQESAE